MPCWPNLRDKLGSMKSGAAFSACRTYRYALWRKWADGPRVLFVMLNPSTADATQDDPTIRRCIGFAKSWGYGSVAVGNLFALRTPSPRVLAAHARPIGAANDRWLRKLQRSAALVVAAWGNHGCLFERSAMVRSLLAEPQTLGLTVQGYPRHPLYVAARTTPQRWR
jgi:hypothetical protein